MSDEPTERGVEALAEAIQARHWPSTTAAMIARDVLASEWYAERIAEARQAGGAEALREAAAAWSSPICCDICMYVDSWLRARADTSESEWRLG